MAVHHIVCRECPFERLEDHKRDAIREATLHSEAEGHETAHAEVA